jgi:predicted O-methyltransferase YrrM
MKCETAVLQNEIEVARFTEILKSENVHSYLEIGGKHGGSLWRAARALPKGSRVVSVDLPHGDTSFKESEPHLVACVEELRKMGYDAHLFLGDSTSPEIVEKVRLLGPYDACFIDANHTEPYVRKDWANYGPMARIVAFHDIGWLPRPAPSKKMPIESSKVWNELKTQFRHEEIKLEPRDNGIGVLWRA